MRAPIFLPFVTAIICLKKIEKIPARAKIARRILGTNFGRKKKPDQGNLDKG